MRVLQTPFTDKGAPVLSPVHPLLQQQFPRILSDLYPYRVLPPVPRFLQALERRLEQDILRFDVCDIVFDHCPALRRVYLPYVTNQAYQEQTYQRLL